MGRTLPGGSQLQLPRSPPPAAVRRRIRGDHFIEADLAAAELLVHLRESSAEAAGSSVSSAASSSSPRSVDMHPPLPPSSPEAVLVGNEKEEEEEEMGLWRRTKRYRLIADLYAATRPVGGGGGEEKPRSRRP